MSGFVIVGRDIGDRDASLVIGTWEDRGPAMEFAKLLEGASKGVYVVLPLHTPLEAAGEVTEAGL